MPLPNLLIPPSFIPASFIPPVIPALFALTLLTLPGCRPPCGFDTEGEPGVTVTLRDASGQDGRLGDGAYAFTVTTELGEFVWSCSVDAAHPGGEACGTSQVLYSEDDPETDAEEPRSSLLLAARLSGDEFLLELSLEGPGTTTGPDTLAVQVERDGVVVGEGMWEPEYVLSRAGGDGCGQTYVAEDPPTLELPAPAP